MSDIAIRVERIGKKYRIGKKKSGELRQSFSNFLNYLKPIANSQKPTTNEFWALKDISFEVKQGEAIGIIGRNGAGKSTLLKVLSRITKPTTGRFEINGRVSSLLEVGTGFHPELTGRENIFLNGTILGMRRVEIKAKFDEIVDFSGVEEFIDTPVKHYSSGMKVRLAFAVAAHLEPEILIIDEVLAVGDAEFQKKCLGKMEDVTGQGRTVLFVSHNMGAVAKLCTNSILLNEGRIIAFADTSEVISNYIIDTNTNKNEKLDRIRLNDFIKIINKNIIHDTLMNSLNIKFTISSTRANKINGIALLFFNALDTRVAIRDLRTLKLIQESKNQTQLSIEDKINLKSFLPGKYYIGLYLDTINFQGNIEKIGSFVIDEPGSEFIPYPVSARGFFKL